MSRAKKSFKAVRRIIFALSAVMDYEEHVEFIARIHALVSGIEEVDREEEAKQNTPATTDKKNLDVS